MKYELKVGVAAMGLVVLAGCTVTPVKEVTADKVGYLTSKFSPQVLSPSVAKKLPASGNIASFGRITIKVETDIEQSDGKKESLTSEVTFIDGGKGLVQRMSEISSNGIPFDLLYSLTYKGIYDLRWQAVPLRGSNSGLAYEVKDISKFDVIPTSAGNEFTVEYTSGTAIQIANLLASKKTCKALRIVGAQEIFTKIQGQAIEFECEQVSNGAIQKRAKTILLQQYGIAIETEATYASRKAVSRVVDFVN